MRWLNNYGKDRSDICRVENGRENSLTIPAPVFFLPEMDAGMGKADGKMKSILRDIRNEICRSGIYRLRSGIKNSNREHLYM